MSGLQVQHVSAAFGRGARAVTVLEDVSLEVPAGGVLGIVGESGSGKSTLARVIAGLITPTRGTVTLGDHTFAGRRTRAESRRIQIAFQDPSRSLNPRMTVEQQLGDACRVTRARRSPRIEELLQLVGLDGQQRRSYPGELSGGQRQRVALARALAAQPDVLICDEVTSALDASSRAVVLNLIGELQRTQGWILLFVSHDIGAVRRVSDDVAVLYAGTVVEVAPARTITTAAQHPYTRLLLDAIPTLRPAPRAHIADFDPVDPREPPSGCRFHPRCPIGPGQRADRQICITTDPGTVSSSKTNHAACHFAGTAVSATPPSPRPRAEVVHESRSHT